MSYMYEVTKIQTTEHKRGKIICNSPFHSGKSSFCSTTALLQHPVKQVLDIDTESELHSVFHKLGVLRALGLIFKHGKREEMLPYSKNVLLRLIATKEINSSDTPVRKLSIKLIQRIGKSAIVSLIVRIPFYCVLCNGLSELRDW